MSTILDALKKSEAARQHNGGGGDSVPDQAPAAARGQHRNWWLVVVALAGITLGITSTRYFAATPAPTAAMPPLVSSPRPSEEVGSTTPIASPSPQEKSTAMAPPPAERPPVTQLSTRPAGVSLNPVAAINETMPADPSAASVPPATDPEPQQTASAVAATPAATPANQTNRERLPAFRQLPALQQQLGELKLTMLVYNADPQRRFALINGERLRHGEQMTNGAELAEIRRDACVLQYAGQKFLLTSGP